MGYWTTGTIGHCSAYEAFPYLQLCIQRPGDCDHWHFPRHQRTTRNLDIGTTVTGSSSGTSSGWAITGDAAGSYTTGNGTVTSGGRTDILLGVLGYTYNGATVGQSATVTLAPPISVTTRFFIYELDGATGKSRYLLRCFVSRLQIVTAPTIIYTE